MYHNHKFFHRIKKIIIIITNPIQRYQYHKLYHKITNYPKITRTPSQYHELYPMICRGHWISKLTAGETSVWFFFWSQGNLFFTDSGPMGETSLEKPKGSVFCVEVADQLLKPLALEVTNTFSIYMSVSYVCHFTDISVFMSVSPHSCVYFICPSLLHWRWHIYAVYTWVRRHTYENAHVTYQTRMGGTHVRVFCVEVADELLKPLTLEVTHDEAYIWVFHTCVT